MGRNIFHWTRLPRPSSSLVLLLSFQKLPTSSIFSPRHFLIHLLTTRDSAGHHQHTEAVFQMFAHCANKSVCMDAWMIPISGWEQHFAENTETKTLWWRSSWFYECDNILPIQKNLWLQFVCRDTRAGQSFELWDVNRRQQMFDDDSCSCDALWTRKINLLGSGIEMKPRSCLRSGAVSSVMIWKPGDHASDDVCATHKEFNPFSQIKALDYNTTLWTERYCASDAFFFIEVQDYEL